MLMPERKKAVTLIVEGMGPSSAPYEREEESSDREYAMMECCMKIMKSIDRKDVKEMCEYMQEFIDMCKEDNPKPEMEMEY